MHSLKRYDRFKRGILLGLFFLFFSILFVFPLMKHGVLFYGDDMAYHINRINEIVANFKHGNYFPVIYTHYFRQIGYPLNIFYPWLTLIPFAIFRLTIQNPVTAIYIGIIFYTFLTFILMYWIGRKFLSTPATLIFSLLYIYSGYRTIDIYARFAVGEFLALTFLPLCFYGFYEILYGDRKYWPAFTIGSTLVVLSHLLSAFIVVFFLGIIFLVSLYWLKQRWQRVCTFLLSGILALFSSAIFLLPFIGQELFQKFAQPSPATLIPKSLPTLISASLSNNFNRVPDQGIYNIGFALLMVIILGLVYFKKLDFKYRIIYLLGTLTFLASSNIFPWNLAQPTFFNVIQFPFRLLILPTLLLSLSGAKIFELIWQDHSTFKAPVKLYQGLMMTAALLLIVLPWYSGTRAYREAATPAVKAYHQHDFNRSVAPILLYLTQYAPKKALPTSDDVINHIAVINGQKQQLTVIKGAPNTLKFVNKRFEKAQQVDLPMFYYKNLVATSGKHVLKITESTRGTVQIKRQGQFITPKIQIHYQLSAMDKSGIFISLITWLGLALIPFYRRYGWLKK